MKTIDAVLIDHKNSNATTLCDLLLVGPLADGSYRGFAGLDTDVTFAPAVSIGAITFKALTSVEISALQMSSNVSVDNGEAKTLPPLPGYEMDGFTQAEIDSGALDTVRFLVLQVNYNDLTAGRCEIVGGGSIGEVRTKIGQMTVLELRSLAQLLNQMIGSLDSLTCRARFGSQPIGSGAAVEERFPCGYDLTSEWVAGTVGSLGTEADLEFTDASLIGHGANWFAPGMLKIVDGDNAGQEVEVEAYDDSTGKVTLRFPLVTLLESGVNYMLRRHCSKKWTGHNSCETFWGAEKALHNRSEPHIPVGDSGVLNSPGAALPRGVGGTGE